MYKTPIFLSPNNKKLSWANNQPLKINGVKIFPFTKTSLITVLQSSEYSAYGLYFSGKSHQPIVCSSKTPIAFSETPKSYWRERNTLASIVENDVDFSSLLNKGILDVWDKNNLDQKFKQYLSRSDIEKSNLSFELYPFEAPEHVRVFPLNLEIQNQNFEESKLFLSSTEKRRVSGKHEFKSLSKGLYEIDIASQSTIPFMELVVNYPIVPDIELIQLPKHSKANWKQLSENTHLLQLDDVKLSNAKPLKINFRQATQNISPKGSPSNALVFPVLQSVDFCHSPIMRNYNGKTPTDKRLARFKYVQTEIAKHRNRITEANVYSDKTFSITLSMKHPKRHFIFVSGIKNTLDGAAYFEFLFSQKTRQTKFLAGALSVKDLNKVLRLLAEHTPGDYFVHGGIN